MQQIGVDGEGGFAALVLGDGDLILLGKFQQFGARCQVPFTPRGDDLDVRVEGPGGQLEADLIVAFAGSAVGDRISTNLLCDLDKDVWRSAGGRWRYQADRRLHKGHWRGTSGRRSRGQNSSRTSSI